MKRIWRGVNNFLPLVLLWPFKSSNVVSSCSPSVQLNGQRERYVTYGTTFLIKAPRHQPLENNSGLKCFPARWCHRRVLSGRPQAARLDTDGGGRGDAVDDEGLFRDCSAWFRSVLFLATWKWSAFHLFAPGNAPFSSTLPSIRLSLVYIHPEDGCIYKHLPPPVICANPQSSMRRGMKKRRGVNYNSSTSICSSSSSSSPPICTTNSPLPKQLYLCVLSVTHNYYTIHLWPRLLLVSLDRTHSLSHYPAVRRRRTTL